MDYLLNDGEDLNEILTEIKKNPPHCKICGKRYSPGEGGGCFSFSESVHLACKEKVGYKRWQAIEKKQELEGK